MCIWQNQDAEIKESRSGRGCSAIGAQLFCYQVRRLLMRAESQSETAARSHSTPMPATKTAMLDAMQ